MDLYRHVSQKPRGSFLHYLPTLHMPMGVTSGISTNGSCWLQKTKVLSALATSLPSVDNALSNVLRNLRVWWAASARGKALGPRTGPDPNVMPSKYCWINEWIQDSLAVFENQLQTSPKAATASPNLADMAPKTEESRLVVVVRGCPIFRGPHVL